MLVKVFKYEVSNSSRVAFTEDKKTDWYRKAQARMLSPEEIEREINEFICDKEVLSIQVSTVDAYYHNNGRGNLIELWYTIVYVDY